MPLKGVVADLEGEMADIVEQETRRALRVELLTCATVCVPQFVLFYSIASFCLATGERLSIWCGFKWQGSGRS